MRLIFGRMEEQPDIVVAEPQAVDGNAVLEWKSGPVEGITYFSPRRS